jgi:hypothetical protein
MRKFFLATAMILAAGVSAQAGYCTSNDGKELKGCGAHIEYVKHLRPMVDHSNLQIRTYPGRTTDLTS